jgi:hypothetical protein
MTAVGALSRKQSASAQASVSRPDIAQACGPIGVGGRQLSVDVAEAIGRGPGSCGTARTVMRRFLGTHPGPYSVTNNNDAGMVRFSGRRYDCYVSRPDGEGWDYHCMWSSGNGDQYIDYAAGRRF